MSAPECAACGCARPTHCRGWCKKHYERWRKHGDHETVLPTGSKAGSTRLKARKNELGNRYNRLIVAGPAPQRKRGKVAWICDCDCGAQVIVTGSDLRLGQVQSCGCLRADSIRMFTHPANVKEIVTYDGAHTRVRRGRGKAADNPCIDCGLPAFQWSYDHSDPNELRSKDGPYSTDPTRYFPRCQPCHRAYDRTFK